MKVVAYLTHPLGPKDADQSGRANNVANAVAWVRWIIESTTWAINASWLTHVIAIDDEIHRPRALVDQMAQLVRCDALILVGGWMSPHMRVEHQFAMKRRIPIVDLVSLGYSPPYAGQPPPFPIKNWSDWFHQQASLPILPLQPT